MIRNAKDFNNIVFLKKLNSFIKVKIHCLDNFEGKVYESSLNSHLINTSLYMSMSKFSNLRNL